MWRVNLRLALMCAHWSGLDLEAEYVGALNRHFAGTSRARGTDLAAAGGAGAGRAGATRPNWASGRDFGGARSLDDFLASAAERRRAVHHRSHDGLIVPAALAAAALAPVPAALAPAALAPAGPAKLHQPARLPLPAGSTSRPGMRWNRPVEPVRSADSAPINPSRRPVSRRDPARTPASGPSSPSRLGVTPDLSALRDPN
jgi:hypothetical protein